MDFLFDIALDAALDSLRLIPFLYLTYLAMEYLENRAGDGTVTLLARTGRKGPLAGGLLGAVPQCGFSAMASTLYAGGVITPGTLLAVYLSTSDEMLPILLSGRAPLSLIGTLLVAKAAVGIVVGFLVDAILAALGRTPQLRIHDLCQREHCCCSRENIFLAALHHTTQILVFLFLITLVLNGLVEGIGVERLMEIVSVHPVRSVFLASLVGLIPNCAASVALTTLYLEGLLPLGSMFAGLLSCAGVGLLVLLRSDRRWKQNLMLVGILYGSSVLVGLLILLF